MLKVGNVYQYVITKFTMDMQGNNRKYEGKYLLLDENTLIYENENGLMYSYEEQKIVKGIKEVKEDLDYFYDSSTPEDLVILCAAVSDKEIEDIEIENTCKEEVKTLIKNMH